MGTSASFGPHTVACFRPSGYIVTEERCRGCALTGTSVQLAELSPLQIWMAVDSGLRSHRNVGSRLAYHGGV